jgi:hypothetical protein
LRHRHLHYVFDLWVDAWRKKCARGDVVVVRYADDNVLGFQYRPTPDRNRKTTWKEFLRHHWELMVAADFFTTEVWTSKGLTRYLVLFSIDLSTERSQSRELPRTRMVYG